jgi:hypothetical protein
MICQRLLFASLFLAVFSVAVVSRDAVADDYVWARTGWGSSNVNGHYSSMSNGYGGYYVPRNAYGNNYESRGNFTNPMGYIVPAGSTYVQPSAQPAQASTFQGHRRHFRRR